MPHKRGQATGAPDVALATHGAWWIAGLIFSLSMLILYIGGYVALRTDHVTQVPMFLKLVHPELYPRDWFLNSTGHYPMRKVFLELNRGLYHLTHRIEYVLFIQFMAYLFVLTAGLWAITRRLGREHWFLLLWVIMIIGGNRFGNLAKAPMIEFQTIPRMYPFAGCVVALALILWRRPLLAGLALGLTGLIQAAPSLQFLIIALGWLLLSEREKGVWKTCGWLVLGFLLTYWPQWLFLRGVIKQPTSYSTAEQILWLAYIRHPHHMLPMEFEKRDYLNMMVLLGLVWAMLRRHEFSTDEQRLLRLFGAFLVYLLISPIFIYGFPIAGWVAFQPYRMMATFRLIVFLFVTIHLWNQIRSGEPDKWTRALFLVFAVWKSDPDYWMLRIYLMMEILLLMLEPHTSRVLIRKLTRVLLPLATFSWYVTGTSRTVGLVILSLALLLRPNVWPWLIARWNSCLRWRGWMPLAVAASALFLVFLFVPFRGWAENPTKWSKFERWHFRFTDDYQVLPYPSDALEWAAVWAKKNTPADALFLVPPERARSSFQYWSERSTVFNIKTFPYVKSEWPLYMERYFALRGLLEPDKYPQDKQVIMDDDGGGGSDGDYERMSAETLLQVARKYKADYIVTQSNHLGRHIGLVAGPFIDLYYAKDGKRKGALYIYQCSASPTPLAVPIESLPVNVVDAPLDLTNPGAAPTQP